jgi:hypothetical protein
MPSKSRNTALQTPGNQRSLASHCTAPSRLWPCGTWTVPWQTSRKHTRIRTPPIQSAGCIRKLSPLDLISILSAIFELFDTCSVSRSKHETQKRHEFTNPTFTEARAIAYLKQVAVSAIFVHTFDECFSLTRTSLFQLTKDFRLQVLWSICHFPPQQSRRRCAICVGRLFSQSVELTGEIGRTISRDALEI